MGRRGHTHVCPVCFATQPAPPVPAYPMCPRCDGEAIGVEVEPIGDFLDRTSLDELIAQRAAFARAKGFRGAYKSGRLAGMAEMIRQQKKRRGGA